MFVYNPGPPTHIRLVRSKSQTVLHLISCVREIQLSCLGKKKDLVCHSVHKLVNRLLKLRPKSPIYLLVILFAMMVRVVEVV